MRKLLLACAAAVGFTGAASAANMDNPLATPNVEPGKVTVRLDAQLNIWAGVSSDSANKSANGGKNQSYGMDGYFRMYPTMNGMTTNGIKYGAAIEIRTNQSGSRSTVAVTGGGGGTVVNPTVGNGNGSTNSTRETFYVRRAYGYVGTDQLGTVRFGQIDGVTGLMKVGDFQGFGDGGLNGDVPDFVPSLAAWQFPFSVGGEYATSKLIYLSPSFAGFDFGISFAPSSSSLLGTVTPASAGLGPTQSTSPIGIGDPRPINTVELNARYRGNFGAVGVAANVGYVTSGKVNDGTATRGMSIFDAGATVSAAGFTFGGHVDTGRFRGQNNLSIAGTKDSTTYLLGGMYQNGPYTIGAHYINDSISAAATGLAQIKTNAGSIGGNWGWAPGAELWFEAETGTVTQGPVKAHGTGLIIAQRFKW